MNTKLLLLVLLTLNVSVCRAEQPPSRLFAAAAFTKAQKDSSIPTDAGLFLRTKDGHWIGFGPKIQAVNSVAVDATEPSRIFLACGNGIVRTTDGGASWRLVTDWRISDVTAVAIDPTDSENVYAASGWGIWKSPDGGDTWTRADAGLAETYSKTLVLDSTEASRLIAGTAGGLFISQDRGETWVRAEGIPPVNILRVRQGAEDPRVWMAGTEGRGAWISSDGAKTWHATAPALDERNLYGVAIDPNDSDRIAVCGWGVGVHVSTDRGQTWIARNAGLPSPNVFALAFDPNANGRLWASTFEEGTIYGDDLGATWQEGGLYGAYVNDLGFAPVGAPSAEASATASR